MLVTFGHVHLDCRWQGILLLPGVKGIGVIQIFERNTGDITQQDNLVCFRALPVAQYPPLRQQRSFRIHAVAHETEAAGFPLAVCGADEFQRVSCTRVTS